MAALNQADQRIRKGWILFLLPDGKVTAWPDDDSGVVVGSALDDEHSGRVLVCTQGPLSAPVETRMFDVFDG